MGRPKGSREKSHIEALNWEKLQELIDTDRLYGYTEFCRLLNIPVKSSGSGSQIKQLSELSMVCEYEKINTKYKFIRMRNRDEIMLYKERSTFTPLIEFALTEKFLSLSASNDKNMKDGILFFSMGNILDWCGIVHQNFEYVRKHQQKKFTDHRLAISFKHNFNAGELLRFVNVSYDKILKPMVRNALRSMDNKKSIVIHKGFKLYRYNEDSFSYNNILASSELGRKIENIIANVWTEFGIKKAQNLHFMSNEKRQKIYDRYNEKCQQELGYDGFYDCYAIVINQARSKHNLQAIKQDLNERVQNRFLSSKYLDDFIVGEKNRFIGTMIDLKTETNFSEDVEEYYKMKMEG